MEFYGILNLSWWGYVWVTLALTHISIVAVTLFFHRAQAHRCLHLHPIVSHFFRFWLWMTTGMVTKAWVAIHRKHHAKCETEDDPHSPQTLGLGTVLWQGSELYRREAKNAETLARYGQGTPDDWIERTVYTPHSAAGILLMFVVNMVLFGIPGIIIAGIQMAWMPFFAAGIINGVGHYWGYRNFDCPDAARNLYPCAVIIGGEELHNNHHAYPTSAKFSIKPWEFDLGWGYICILQFFGLAKPKRVAPIAHSVSGKEHIEDETLMALIANKIQVMSHYTKSVLLPVLNHEVAHARKEGSVQAAKVLGLAKRVIMRESTLKDAVIRDHFDTLLERHQNLQQAYQFRMRLQAIWGQTTASKNELLAALHDWCAEAEKSGVKVLKDFSDYLKGYSLQGISKR